MKETAAKELERPPKRRETRVNLVAQKFTGGDALVPVPVGMKYGDHNHMQWLEEQGFKTEHYYDLARKQKQADRIWKLIESSSSTGGALDA